MHYRSRTHLLAAGPSPVRKQVTIVRSAADSYPPVTAGTRLQQLPRSLRIERILEAVSRYTCGLGASTQCFPDALACHPKTSHQQLSSQQRRHEQGPSEAQHCGERPRELQRRSKREVRDLLRIRAIERSARLSQPYDEYYAQTWERNPHHLRIVDDTTALAVFSACLHMKLPGELKHLLLTSCIARQYLGP